MKNQQRCVCVKAFSKAAKTGSQKNNSPKRGSNLSIKLKKEKVLKLFRNSDKPFHMRYNNLKLPKIILMFENIVPFKRNRTPLRCVLSLWYNIYMGMDRSVSKEVRT